MAAQAKREFTESFDERVDLLFRELERSIRFDRPSILLAVYQSEYTRAEAEALLAAKLHELDQIVAEYRVTGEDDANIPLVLSLRTDKAKTVYFVSGLQWGGGRENAMAYRALNIRREYFVDHRIRAVFWLTEREAVALPRLAPDFWAFRHRVVEFVEPPRPERIVPIARELAWRDLVDDRTLREDTDAKIQLRLALLTDLPEGDETMAARADLLSSLTWLYFVKSEYKESIRLWQQTLGLAERLEDANLQSQCHNGLGVVYAAMEYHDDAIAEYQRAIKIDPGFAAPHYGLGRVYRDLGRTDDAIAAYQRAIELDPKYATPHNGLGNVYADLGRTDDAIAAYQRAIELDPKSAYPHNGLGNVYRDLGRADDAIAEYQRAIELDPKYASPHNNLAGIYMEQREFAQAQYHFNERIHLSPDTALNALVSLGIIARYQDDANSDDYFRRALTLWDKAWQARLQTPTGLLENKALALVCLGQREEALETLRDALDQRVPGDTLEFFRYELLAEAPKPPDGIDEMMEMLREAKQGR
jgi:tetratricopeptide (TPR) repeat protein